MYGIHRSFRQMNVDTTSRKLNIPKSKCLPLKLCVRLRGYVCYSGLGYLKNIQCCEVTGKKRLFFSLISCVCVCCTLHAPSNIPDKRRWCAEVCHANITLDSCSLNDYSILKTYWMRNECFRTIRILFEATWICCDDSMSPVHYLNDGLVLHAIQSNKNANGLCFY